MRTMTFRTFILLKVICKTAIKARIIWKINCEIWDIFIHCIIYKNFKSINIIFYCTIKFNISYTSRRRITRELTFDINFIKRTYFFSNWNMNTISKIILITYIRNNTIFLFEFFHCSITQIFCGRIINSKI